MKVNYNNLFKKLIDKGWKKTDLIEKAGVSTNIVAKLGKGEPISMESLQKICTSLNCNVGDIVAFEESSDKVDIK